MFAPSSSMERLVPFSCRWLATLSLAWALLLRRVPGDLVIPLFDCDNGQAHWQTDWSETKKEWCCSQPQVLCDKIDKEVGATKLKINYKELDAERAKQAHEREVAESRQGGDTENYFEEQREQTHQEEIAIPHGEISKEKKEDDLKEDSHKRIEYSNRGQEKNRHAEDGKEKSRHKEAEIPDSESEKGEGKGDHEAVAMTNGEKHSDSREKEREVTGHRGAEVSVSDVERRKEEKHIRMIGSRSAGEKEEEGSRETRHRQGESSSNEGERGRGDEGSREESYRQVEVSTAENGRERQKEERHEGREDEGEMSGDEGGEEEAGEGASEEEEGEEESEEERVEESEEESDVDLAIALILLGFVCFVMILLSLVNHPDPDMKFYSWQIVSDTMSIFVAVLMFSSFNSIVHEVLLEGQPKTIHGLGDFCQMCMYLVLVQFLPALLAGVFDPKMIDPDDSNKRTLKAAAIAQKSKGEVAKLEAESQKGQCERRIKCWATLFAHMTGFAAINTGGTFQHGEYFGKHALSTFGVAGVMYVGHALLGRAFKLLRTDVLEGIKKQRASKPERYPGAKEDLEEVFEGYEEEVSESMNDIASLCVSFLTVQALRFNISGVLPDNLGVEESREEYYHDQKCVYWLLVSSLLFACGSIVLTALSAGIVKSVFPNDWPSGKHHPTIGTKGAFLKRLLNLAELTMSMCMAWCMLFAFKWQVTLSVPPLENPNVNTSRLCTALGISFFAFLVVTALDQLMDKFDTAGSDFVGDSIAQLIKSISMLVGFSWEQAFDGGVEVIAEMAPIPAVYAELALASFIACVCISPWRRYMLGTVIKLEKQREEEERLEMERQAKPGCENSELESGAPLVKRR